MTPSPSCVLVRQTEALARLHRSTPFCQIAPLDRLWRREVAAIPAAIRPAVLAIARALAQEGQA